MLPAVGLDDKPTLLADEVGDERADRLLPPKLGPIELASPKR